MELVNHSTMSNRFSNEELKVLRSLFDSCDTEGAGKIHINQFPGLLSKVGKTEDEIISITEAAAKQVDEMGGMVDFERFVIVLEDAEAPSDMPFEGPDPKVLEFLRIEQWLS